MAKIKILEIPFPGKRKHWSETAIRLFRNMYIEDGTTRALIKWTDDFFYNEDKKKRPSQVVSHLRDQVDQDAPDLVFKALDPELGKLSRSHRYLEKEYFLEFKEPNGQTSMENLHEQPAENEESLPVDTIPDELLPVDGETGADEKTYYDILMEHLDHEFALLSDLLATHYCMMNKIIGRIG